MKSVLSRANALCLISVLSLISCGRHLDVTSAKKQIVASSSQGQIPYTPASSSTPTPTPTPTPLMSSQYVMVGGYIMVSASPTPTPTPAVTYAPAPASCACPTAKSHAKTILASTQTPGYGNPASAVLGDIKPRDGSTNFENDGDVMGFVKVGFETTIVNGPGVDFVVHGEGQDEDFAVYVWSLSGERILLAEVPRAYPYNTGGSLDLYDIGFDLDAAGVSEIVAVEIRNREDRPSWHVGEGPDLRGFTAVYCR